MKNIDIIINHPLFRLSMEKVREYEADRAFCCHGIAHSLDVARIAYIDSLEQHLEYSKEMIYAAALLHDIGRWQQYAEQIPHEEAGALISAEILRDTAFAEKEVSEILSAIGNHRGRLSERADDFGRLLYRADKKSRVCWLCGARAECYWPEEQKNRTIDN